MGNQKSSPKTEQSDDSDVDIINTKELHTDLHLDHELKLWVVIILISLQFTVTAYKLIAKRERKKEARMMAKSIAHLNEVVVQKK